ncbi:MAG: DUF1499 domain-containing protein [Gemmatimonadota bacterium]|nr:DUF1499 domain-containing protein [Gemmatimonadota bacterium]
MRETLHRWLHENVADTRRPGPPEGRVYQVPFAQVWDEILARVEAKGRWELRHRDEELGLITVACRSLVFRFIDDLTVWVALDEDGLTRVDALSRARKGRGDLGVNRRRIERLLRGLDEAFGADARLADPRAGAGVEIPVRTAGDQATA